MFHLSTDSHTWTIRITIPWRAIRSKVWAVLKAVWSFIVFMNEITAFAQNVASIVGLLWVLGHFAGWW